MPRKKGGKRSVNKSQFVREQPGTMTAKQVVTKAKDAGITLSEKYVYNIRAKANARKRVGRPGRPGRPPKAATAMKTSGGGNEARLVDLALDMGLAKAEALLSRLRSKIREAALS
jgi:hypothetical protein